MVDLVGIFEDTKSIFWDGDTIGEPTSFNGGAIALGVTIRECVEPPP